MAISLPSRNSNPYIAGDPVRDPALFFGRDDLITKMIQSLAGNHLAIQGQRRSGKTSLLLKLAQSLREINQRSDYESLYIPVYLNCQRVSESEFFFRLMAALLDECGRTVPEINKDAFLHGKEPQTYNDFDLEEDLKKICLRFFLLPSQSIKFVLCIDEGDFLNQYSSKMQDQLRGMVIGNEALKMVWAGTRIDEVQQNYGSPWYNLFVTYRLTPLDEIEAIRLIQDPAKKLGYTFPSEIVQTILSYSGKQPYIIQYLCHEAISHMLEEGRVRVALNDIERASSKFEHELNTQDTNSVAFRTTGNTGHDWPIDDKILSKLTFSNVLMAPNDESNALLPNGALLEADRLTLGHEYHAPLTLNPAVNQWILDESSWPSELDWKQYAMRPVVGLVYDRSRAKLHPLVIDLPRGHFAIFGASRWGKTTFIRTLVASLAATHSPGHVQIYLLELGGQRLDVLENIPHVGAVIHPDDVEYEERVRYLLNEVEEAIDQRQEILGQFREFSDIYAYNAQHSAAPLPAMVVIIDHFVEFKLHFGSKESSSEIFNKFVRLTRRANRYAIHFVISVSHADIFSDQISSSFTERLTLKLTDAKEYRAILGGDVPEIGYTPGRGYIKLGHSPLSCQIARIAEVPQDAGDDLATETRILLQFAQNMNKFVRHSGHSYQQPLSITTPPQLISYKQLLAKQYLVEFDEHNFANLLEIVRQQWFNSVTIQNIHPLQGVLGITSGNRLRWLHFDARKDGIHGAIFGDMESGKSELVKTLLLSLALRYDPRLVNFAVIDYRASGKFREIENLPHCIGTIAYDIDSIGRMFHSLQSEIERRRLLNLKTQTNSIGEFYQRGFQETTSYPYLFIVIDEFSDIVADNPEYRVMVENILRLGRMRGIHLILVSQQATHFSDMLWANLKFRVCLRIESEKISQAILGNSAGTSLPRNAPGRGYLHINNRTVELIQSAYTGDGDADKILVQSLINLASQLGIKKSRKLWSDSLPSQISLSEILISRHPETSALLSEDHLFDSDKVITQGLHWTETLTLNPSVNQWLSEENGWIEPLDWTKYAMRPVVGLVDNPFTAKLIPLTVDFTRGHVVIFAASGWGKTTFLRTVIVSLAATHSPTHLHIYLLDLGGRNLTILGLLPHVGATITPDEAGYSEQVIQLLRELSGIVKQRQKSFEHDGITDIKQYNQLYPDAPLPAILVVIDNFDEFKETFEFKKTVDEEDITWSTFINVLRRSRQYGIHFVISVSEFDTLSNRLYGFFPERFSLKLTDPSKYAAIVGRDIEMMDELPGRGYIKIGNLPLSFQIAQPVDLRREGLDGLSIETKALEKFSQNMWQYLLRKSQQYTQPVRISALPDFVSFSDMVARQYGQNENLSFLEYLKPIVENNWQQSRLPQNANWLQVAIGIQSGNRVRSLVISARQDGIHGMIAGGMGSGKTELLITLIISLAIQYDPSIVNFVLVDYKGGGAFRGLAELPHCVERITNLSGDALQRMFTVIMAEIQRRQKLNADTNTKTIVEYRQKNLHTTFAPYPFLIIIIDEFAEMLAANPTSQTQLESIIRLGRTHGVSLILAAQRPTGITDEMRSLIKFRIAFRLETAAESREVLHREDAAYLPSVPGRGYLRVGNDELELIQVAYTSERYSVSTREPDSVLRSSRSNIIDQEETEFYRVLVLELGALAKKQGAPKQISPWPSSLPRKFSLTGFSLNPPLNHWRNGDKNDIGWPAINDPKIYWLNYAARSVIGLVDDPEIAKQSPLVIDLSNGHVVLFGASGLGKTSFLRTLAVSLMAVHSPNQLWLYLLEMGGRSLSVLNKFPHVGAVLMPDEVGFEERVEQMFRMLDELIEKRKTMLSYVGADDIYKYNIDYPSRAQPIVVVAIDNILEFKEAFDRGEENIEDVMKQFIAIARQSKLFGVHFVITACQMEDVTSQVYSLFTERLTLKLSEPTEVRLIIGGDAGDIADIPGRGIIKLGLKSLSFQIALPLELNESDNEAQHLEQVAEAMVDFMEQRLPGVQWQRPIGIYSLPKAILLKQLLARQWKCDLNDQFLTTLREQTWRNWQDSLDASKAAWLQVMLGTISGNRPRTLHFSADKDGVHGMIAGGTGSGKSELLMTLIVGMAINYDPSILNFVLVDYKGGGAFTPFKDLPHCVEMVTNLNKSAVRRFFTSINAEMRRRQKLNTDTATKHIIEYREKGLHKTFSPYPHLFVIIDEYAEMISSNPEYKAELDSIVRLGRAQGVNLLLASQRLKDVTDHMRSNMKLRICLRVEELDTSREILRRPDAAMLPSIPGRGYLQVGNEGIELIQIAYAGEEMMSDFEMPDDRRPKFYDVVVHQSQELLHRVGVDRPDTPWPPFLPTHLTLSDSVIEKYLNREHLPLMLTPHMGSQHLEVGVDHLVAATHNQHNAIKQGKKPVSLNLFVQEWMQGHFAWFGVDWNRTALRGIAGLVDDPANSCQLPMTIDFTKGHVIIFGGSGYGKTTLIRSLIVSLAATHSPDEFHVHLLDLGGRNLVVLKALPHVGTVLMLDEQGFEEQVQQLWRKLNEEIDRRKRKFAEVDVSTLYEYNGQNPQQVEPAILVAIDNFGEYIENFVKATNATDESSPMGQFVALARQAKSYGIHFLITVPHYNTLSNNLHSLFTERFTLRMADPNDYRSILGVSVPEIDEIPGRGYLKVGHEALEFQVATPIADQVVQNFQVQFTNEFRLIRQLGAQMHKVGKGRWNEDRQPLRIGAMPRSSSYRELISKLYGFTKEHSFIEQLYHSASQRWQQTASAEKADWLRVAIGLVSGDSARELYWAAKADGVHGLIAGGTGSGKSELLTTLICGLVLNYDPTILNFVLVDYKGGGAFTPFAPLPHCVDIVTNLNKAAVRRMFTSINAEIRRRQELNARTGTKDIVDYRSKNLHKTLEAYPHLFIIIDEYAEMIDDNPDYKVDLESITRVGRAQGINLLLASQHPKDVTDQMRSNMKLRVCLRVEEQDTSREMLRRPDAALLPSIPGRGYLQVGNEGIELIQIAYTGERQPDDRQPNVIWPTRLKSSTVEGETPRLFDTIVDLAAEMNQRQMAPKPWPSFLPDYISLQSPLYDAQNNRWFTLSREVYGAEVVSDWLNGDTAGLWPGIDWSKQVLQPVLGLLDQPNLARQTPLCVDLSRTHLAVYGDGATGKTSFLRMLLTSLAATHSPNELHSYIIDMDGRNFRSLETLPHLGAVLYSDDESFDERLHRLFGRLTTITMQRQQIIADAGANTLYEYNERFPDKALPAILVLIDNFVPLRERYEALLEVTVTPLIRRSLSIGITFVITANNKNNVSYRLGAFFGEEITFHQANLDRYADIVGRGSIEIDHIPGRGYIRINRIPLMFQMALPVDFSLRLSTDTTTASGTLVEAAELKLFCQNMRNHIEHSGMTWHKRPEAIHVLPSVVSLQYILAQVGEARERLIDGVLGENERLLPASFNLKRLGPHFAISGPPLSGKSTVLYNWVFSLAWRFSPEQMAIVVIDLQNKFFEWGGSYTIGNIPHVIATISEKEQLVKLSEDLRRECEALFAKQSTREIFVIIDNYEDFSDELEKEWELVRDLASMARRYGRDGLHFIIGGSLTGTGNDLRRQVQASNYGIGLRTEQAVDTLGVARTPPGIRGRELPVGRGYIVKSGEATMIQVATPYELSGLVVADEQEQKSLALDGWVRRLIAKYPSESTQRSQRTVQQAVTTVRRSNSNSLGLVGFDHTTRQLLDLLKNIAAYPQDDNFEMISNETEKSERPLLDVSDWDDKRVLVRFIGDALQRKTGMDVNTIFDDAPDEIISMALQEFPPVIQTDDIVLEWEEGQPDQQFSFPKATWSQHPGEEVTKSRSTIRNQDPEMQQIMRILEQIAMDHDIRNVKSSVTVSDDKQVLIELIRNALRQKLQIPDDMDMGLLYPTNEDVLIGASNTFATDANQSPL